MDNDGEVNAATLVQVGVPCMVRVDLVNLTVIKICTSFGPAPEICSPLFDGVSIGSCLCSTFLSPTAVTHYLLALV